MPPMNGQDERRIMDQWLLSYLHEKIKGDYMPSWVLLSMTAVEERVRENKTKL